jgi:hypothetical protein
MRLDVLQVEYLLSVSSQEQFFRKKIHMFKPMLLKYGGHTFASASCGLAKAGWQWQIYIRHNYIPRGTRFLVTRVSSITWHRG